ncbi:MAG: hypothetical protein ACP6KW_00160 [Candidatus Thorarchaeota archaeon]
MSTKTRTTTSLKSLEKKAKLLDIKTDVHTVIFTSPTPEALCASIILCRAIRRTGGRFHLSFCPPLLDISTLIGLREAYSQSSILFVGVDIQGKKRIKKGAGYPLFIGCTWESGQVTDLALGSSDLTCASAYILAQAQMETSDYELQMASTGILLQSEYKEPPIKANMEIVNRALNAGLVEKRSGYRLYGSTSLPLEEVFLYSTHPYLKGISGSRKGCDALLNDAEIPIPSFGEPISYLTSENIQNLNQRLIERVDAGIVTNHLLAGDFLLVKEDTASPLHTLSSIERLHAMAWARGELGSMASVLLGDRGSSLITLVDRYMTHQKEVLNSLQHIETSVSQSDPLPDNITLPGSNSSVLTDVGRICLESHLTDTATEVIVVNDDDATEIVWSISGISMNQALRRILAHDVNVPPTATSKRSLRFPRLEASTSQELVSILTTTGGKTH